MPLTQWRAYRARVQQKKVALQLLALSGAVRPSHIELRYGVPPLKLKAINQGPQSIHTVIPDRRRSASAHLTRMSPLSVLQRDVRDLPFLHWLRKVDGMRAGTAEG